jgi:hypothetical protein
MSVLVMWPNATVVGLQNRADAGCPSVPNPRAPLSCLPRTRRMKKPGIARV